LADDAQGSQQIRDFDTTPEQLPELTAKTLGDKGGVVAFGGEYGSARFDGVKGVAIDNAGNYYVASNGVGASQFASPVSLDVRRSGWHDIQHAVTAMQLPDGRRYAFSEENGTGKVLLYKGY
jgi:hypothetical protein